MEGTWKRIQAAVRRMQASDAPPDRQDVLLREIRDVRLQLRCAQRRFDQLADGDLVESCIYELESLQARYRFLLQRARAEGLRQPPFPAPAGWEGECS